ncbi:MAG TPA: energy transducer TonB [Thermoanaerobaculia bacterium]|nr:energy transducer TonB [Thermoanaerobaculia bacterium]
MKITPLAIFIAVVLPLITARACSAAWPSKSSRNPTVVLQWKERLEVANGQLKRSAWPVGAAIADSVIHDMRERLGGGKASGDLLAAAFLFRAIGQAGLDDEADAAWDFGVAQALYPPYEKVDLRPYGPAGQALSKHRYRNGVPPGSAISLDDGSIPSGDLKPPRVRTSLAAVYPLGQRQSCDNKVVHIRAVVDEQGRPSYPSLPAQTDPVIAFAALEAVRQWTFEPATRSGQPVLVSLLLSVDFHIPGC